MEIKILKSVILDFDGKSRVYSPSDKIISIADDLAEKNKYVERYQKYPEHIKIVEMPKVVKPKAKKAAKKKE